VSVVVSDASPLHYLIECGAISSLNAMFGELVIPPAVFAELQHPRTPRVVHDWMANLPGWIKIQAPQRIDESLNLDRGENEAISLAKEIGATLLLIDDRKGRIEAGRRGIRVAGTLGVLEAAGRRGLIDFAKAIGRLRSTRARIDEELIESALARLRQK
jgi:predicted nucleic acid-binding protein